MATRVIDNKRYDVILQELKEMFPGRLVLSVGETAGIYRIKINYLYNRIGKNTDNPFPVRPIRFYGRPLFRIHDIAKDLASSR